MTLGEERVRKGFNPAEDLVIDEVKNHCARMIDACSTVSDDPEKKRCLALAATAFEEGCMWMVKAMSLIDYRDKHGHPEDEDAIAMREYPADHPAPGDLGSVPT